MKRSTFIFLASFLSLIIIVQDSFSQQRRRRSRRDQPVTYSELYDAPYEINKLFVQLVPLYGDMFVSNINVGFGLEATYYWEDKFDFHVGTRKAYSKTFDFARSVADNNSNVDNLPNIYNYYELGATYHIKDWEEDTDTKMFLFKKSYKGDKWAARTARSAEVPCKVRKVYGGRLGGFAFDTSTDINRAMKKQGQSLSELTDTEGNALPLTFVDGDGEDQEVVVFGNVDVAGIYIGGSMSWIKNVAVDFDNKYQPGVDDLILKTYVDILVAPAVSVEDIIYTNPATGVTGTFSSDPIKTNKVGFRLGVDGKFNRTFSWSYGGELGYRPTVKGRGLFALIKISFPVYSTNLKYSVEAFGK